MGKYLKLELINVRGSDARRFCLAVEALMVAWVIKIECSFWRLLGEEVDW
jgi:hypothetical protein